MKNTGSNLTTFVGLMILILLIFLAAYLNIPALEAFLIIITILCVAAWIWSKYALHKISASLTDNELSVFCGDEVQINAQIINSKLLPLIWLRAELAGRRTDLLESDKLSKLITWIMPFQELSFNWKVKTKSRGICSIDSFILKSGDGFGLSEKLLKQQTDNIYRIIVYPRLQPVNPGYIMSHLQEMEDSPYGFYTDRTLLKNTRPYTGRESYRDINWRTLAMGKETEVNLYEEMAMKRVCFIPDLESYTYTQIVKDSGEPKEVKIQDSEKFEYALSLIASLTASLEKRGVLISLIIPSYKGKNTSAVLPENHKFQTKEILTAISAIDYRTENTELNHSVLMDNYHKLGQIFVFSCSKEKCTVRLPDDYSVKYCLTNDEETAGYPGELYIDSRIFI